jgi:hypothetical protein
MGEMWPAPLIPDRQGTHQNRLLFESRHGDWEIGPSAGFGLQSQRAFLRSNPTSCSQPSVNERFSLVRMY